MLPELSRMKMMSARPEIFSACCTTALHAPPSAPPWTTGISGPNIGAAPAGPALVGAAPGADGAVWPGAVLAMLPGALEAPSPAEQPAQAASIVNPMQTREVRKLVLMNEPSLAAKASCSGRRAHLHRRRFRHN